MRPQAFRKKRFQECASKKMKTAYSHHVPINRLSTEEENRLKLRGDYIKTFSTFSSLFADF